MLVVGQQVGPLERNLEAVALSRRLLSPAKMMARAKSSDWMVEEVEDSRNYLACSLLVDSSLPETRRNVKHYRGCRLFECAGRVD